MKRNGKEEESLKMMLENNLAAVVYPRDKSKEAAERLANQIDSAIGIAEFVNEDEEGAVVWGVLIDKIKQGRKKISK